MRFVNGYRLWNPLFRGYVAPSLKSKEIFVHPTAIIGSSVELCSGVHVGPYTVLRGDTRIGAGTTIGPFCDIGGPPSDVVAKGAAGRLEIDENVRIASHVTVHVATDDGATRVRAGAFLMPMAHVGHDVDVGSGAVICNAAALAGHVVIGDGAVVGGLSGIHQRVNIGPLSMIGGLSMVVADVPAMCTVAGSPARLMGINTVGIERYLAASSVSVDADVDDAHRSRQVIARLHELFEQRFVHNKALLRGVEKDPIVHDFIEYTHTMLEVKIK